uniref:ATP synthase complex subunit 8 n=1 Tax=Platygonus compressus TaxID=1983451 RepID=A0A1W6LQV9_9CETA|nr:ATP synthase F0 subunit 8 [Platygonus compressus]ARN58895.1 ATP synthase F0 subunit 8 [Platygonus compressus]ARN58907.1 ATP synthase F0 subunit 8 [Platygonus compressus]ARN58932.1 ATP synthase F0 subunit 8 [Platygonus compressus]ARN58970.1 ATP synthase F0 subunit 8 [Platygonus compressus]
MPQLDTSTWFITIMSMLLVLFIMFQLKVSNHMYPMNPELIKPKLKEQKTPWETKWTKIYSPLSLPLQ